MVLAEILVIFRWSFLAVADAYRMFPCKIASLVHERLFQAQLHFALLIR